jgi:DNA-binding response OmpR family regulator
MQFEEIKCPCCGQVAPTTGEVEVNLHESTIRYNGETIYLTRRLAKLAHTLASRMPSTVTHDEVAAKMWGDAEIDVFGNLKVAVSHLRRALGSTGIKIQATWGLGYRMVLPSQTERSTTHQPEAAHAQA